MLRRLILRKLGTEERRMGVSLDYLRHILGTSFKSFFVFTKIMPISNHRRKLPVEPYYVARLVATRDEDCGTCVQIEVNLAKEEGVADGEPALVELAMAIAVARFFPVTRRALGYATSCSRVEIEV